MINFYKVPNLGSDFDMVVLDHKRKKFIEYNISLDTDDCKEHETIIKTIMAKRGIDTSSVSIEDMFVYQSEDTKCILMKKEGYERLCSYFVMQSAIKGETSTKLHNDFVRNAIKLLKKENLNRPMENGEVRFMVIDVGDWSTLLGDNTDFFKEKERILKEIDNALANNNKEAFDQYSKLYKRFQLEG